MTRKPATTSASGRSQTTQRPAAVTTRSTSGVGFELEDDVAAWLLVKMLTGQPLPGTGALGSQIRHQVHALGWTIDDLLVDGEGPALAISCKGNRQVTANGLPSGFVEAAWQQTERPAPAEGAAAHFALATRGRNMAFEEPWANIKEWAAGADDELTLARIAASPREAAVFRSVQVPSGAERDPRAALALTRRLHVLPLDFQLQQSSVVADSIERCRSLLRSGSHDEGTRLWQALRERARLARIGGGATRLADLWVSLREAFTLKDHPNYAPSWQVLRDISNDHRATVITDLPDDVHIARAQSVAELQALIAAELVVLVVGESGAGKSALVKLALDFGSPGAAQVWLGPEDLEALLTDTRRRQLDITYPLAELLKASAAATTVLVIDAAERLTEQTAIKTQSLIRELAALGSSFRTVIVGQTAWASSAPTLTNGIPLKLMSVEPLAGDEVAAALRQSPAVAWLAGRVDLLQGLTNPRTLGWVMAAGVGATNEAGVATPPAIIDLIFRRWTAGQAALERLLMQLAQREANFERSFAVSDLEQSEAAAWDSRPAAFPMRRNRRGRLEFEHDLAADWARFEWLRQTNDIGEVADLAVNPLWNGALRLFGQMLLRETDGDASAWDRALDALAAQNATPLAIDLLLDALFTDPEADRFLEAKADRLFANGAKLLQRLLVRFYHVATVSALNPAAGIDPALRLHLENELRFPTITYWPALCRFLYRHRERVAALATADAAKLCAIWLSRLPVQLQDGQPMPLRREFAEIALACGRALQLELLKNRFHSGSSDQPTFAAALMAADELPDVVAQWSLEMARRRELPQALKDEVGRFHLEEARQRAEREKNAPDRGARKRSMPSLISGRTRLPPWPMGPAGRLQRGFREAVIRSGATAALMRARPAIATEVILAALVEDEPERGQSRAGLNDGYGLEFDHESYPTAYWKSPFLLFLGIDPASALAALIQLVDFCTDRWAGNISADRIPAISLELDNGTVKRFAGNHAVFDWAESASNHSGQLNCALAALEKWLCVELDSGKSIDTHLSKILAQSQSAALLGVLVNVGKYQPRLFAGPLRPLLRNSVLYRYDDWRAKQQWRFDALNWTSSGDLLFGMAREFALAPHRQVALRRVAAALLRTDATLAREVAAADSQWVHSNDPKGDLELDALIAELDPGNYQGAAGHAETEGVIFAYPEALQRRISALQSTNLSAQTLLSLPGQCQRILQTEGDLTEASAQSLAGVLTAPAPTGVDAEFAQEATVAAAGTLLARGGTWISDHPDAETRATEIVAASLRAGATAPEERRAAFFHRSAGLTIAAHAIVDKLAQGAPSGLWDELALLIVTGTDRTAIATLFALAHTRRTALAGKWHRLVFLGLLMAGLSILSPRYEDDAGSARRWARRLGWLRARSLSHPAPLLVQLDLLRLSERVGRLERAQWHRRSAAEFERYGVRMGSEHVAIGLDSDYLHNMFAWLLQGDAPLAGDERALLRSLWAFEAWLSYGRRGEDDDNDQPPDQLGYDVLDRTARLLPTLTLEAAGEHWQPILAFGANAHYAIQHFLSAFTLLLSKASDLTAPAAHWRAMIDYALASTDWTASRHWYHGEALLCQILGFGNRISLGDSPAVAALVTGLGDYYERWAREHLGHDEDNVARFCSFLTTRAASGLRLRALPWVANALAPGQRAAHWYRETTSSALISYLETLIAEEGASLAGQPILRDAALGLIGMLAGKQVPRSLALQDRLLRLR